MSGKLSSIALFAAVIGGATAAAQPVATVQGPPIVITRQLPPSADLLFRVVHIGDLDLKSAPGQQEMEKRVSQAVDDLCAIPTPLPSYKGVMEGPCREEAWGSARPQMQLAIERAHSGS